jgi:putative sterol carrier protein
MRGDARRIRSDSVPVAFRPGAAALLLAPMFLIDIPAGTTLETLLTEVVPALHVRYVTDDSKDEYAAVVRVEDGPSYTYVVQGRSIRVDEGEADRVRLWISVKRDAVELFLADWMGPKRFVPTFVPPGGVVLFTDPRILKRLVMATGKLEVALSDHESGRVAMTVAFGDAAKKGIDTDDPNVVLEGKTRALERILSGDLAPEEALVDGDVSVKGNRFVAMQLALALAPFYPAKR